ncbi:MAG: HlyD family type I secretion periplasmic adaptor subunit [Rhizobiaceae bacterium]|nr:HlyD family type I secretion periplasmic adaptor subunit [Rhizobiaceae bacterium]
MSNAIVPNRNYEILDPASQQVPHTEPINTTRFSRFVSVGVMIVSLFVGGSAYWAFNANLDGAIVAPASFVVEGNRKTVQHLEGGIVSELLVREGDFVSANQVLIRMDSTENDVNLDVLGSQFTELNVRRARLLAELSEETAFSLADLVEVATVNSDESKLAAVFGTQKRLFDAQLRTSESEKEILEKRVSSLEQEIEGLEVQRSANGRQLEIAKSELSSFNKLLQKGLTQVSRVNAVKREIERLKGLDASFTTSQARALNQIGELRLSYLGQKKVRKEAITTELASIEAQISNIEPQYVGALQRQKRIEIKAPVSGHVVNMSIYTKGGVIRPGESVLDIVPADQELIVEAKVNTTDIEKLRVGQNTRVRLTAFDQTDVPEANGQIVDLSADSIVDERTGAEYYSARVRLDDAQPNDVRDLKFVPGMPADVFVNTGTRTAISYLTQPLKDRIARTFIE